MTPPEDPDVLWNFEKFLVSRDGAVVDRFAPATPPEDPTLVQAIDGSSISSGLRVPKEHGHLARRGSTAVTSLATSAKRRVSAAHMVDFAARRPHMLECRAWRP